MSKGHKQDHASLSLPTSRKVCGVEIKKMPIGAYLQTIEKMKNMPQDFMDICFPEQSLQDVLDNLSTIDEAGITSLATSLFVAVPTYAVGMVADLTGIDEDRLINDGNIGLDGFIAIVNAFIEVNRLGEFLRGVTLLKSKVKGLKTLT